MSFFPGQSNKRTSFPELMGQSAQQAAAYIAAQGLEPVLVKPNQPVTMDYRNYRVRIRTDPSGRVVIQIPNVG